MLLTVKISHILYIFAFVFVNAPSATFCENTNNMAEAQQFYKGLESFGIRLFSELVKPNPGKNIVFSPFSIQTCIAMARMGAENKTSDEMDQVLGFRAEKQKPEELAKSYHAILESYVNSSILKIANKIYLMKGFEAKEEFNELLTKQFFSSAETVDFGDNKAAAGIINNWVESKTNNLIKDLISPEVLSADTRLVLVNAIHFKGEWTHQFPIRSTREMDFYLDETKTVKVQMMRTKHEFRYGEFPDIDATALEMPYKESDLSMLVILPNSRTGLADVEKKLKHVTLSDLTEQMYSTKVIVDMPKFKAEFQVELTEPLKKLGMSRMFSGNAEFGNMLKSDDRLQVSAVVHKAFIEVNEKGTEAAAATAMLVTYCSMPMFEEPPKHFNVNKQFHYALLNKEGVVFFKGCVHEF